MNCEYCGTRLHTGDDECRKCSAPVGWGESPVEKFKYPDASGFSMGYVVSDSEDANALRVEWERDENEVTYPDESLRYEEPERFMPEYVVWALGQGLFVCLMYAIYLVLAWIFGG